jgi:hypothetical protein
MTKKTPDPSNGDWLERFMAGTTPVTTGVPAFRPQPSPSERKADERTRAVREMTDTETEKRLSTTARLKAARLAKEAEDRAQAALEAAPKKGKRKPKG